MMLNMAGSVSPDSTASISSLLASCSLNSTGPSSRSHTSVTYKDRLYDSASKALEDYIQDYEEGLLSTETKAGKISSRARLNQPIKKRELQHQPSVSSRRRKPLTRDADLLSLTTDDLISFPSDGSLPLYRPYQSEHKHSGTRKTIYGPSFRKQKSSQTPPAYSKRHLHLMDRETYNDIAYGSHKERHNGEYSRHVAARGNKTMVLTPPGLRQKTLLPTKDYPRWLTSHKSELSVSGITSVPEAKYPVWLKNHGLLSNSDSELSLDRFKSNQDVLFSEINQRLHRAGTCSYNPTRVSYSDDEGFYKLKESKHAIGHPKTPLKSENFDLLLQKPEDGDNFKAEISSPLHYERSPQTEDFMEAERSWENIPYPVKSPVQVISKDSDLGIYSQSKSVEDTDGFLTKDHTACRTSVSTFSGGNHHGPVEALKHMLFNLQTFQHSFTQGKTTEQIEEIHKVSKEADEDLRPLDQEMFPVNKSLQKALHHLSRLKELVGDSSMKQYKEKKEES
ncbi:lung adenoma susceptibility protein 2 [Xenopus laevis]|nr:lung adenoma susceptibility protein 2 [Xenopus laevis]